MDQEIILDYLIRRFARFVSVISLYLFLASVPSLPPPPPPPPTWKHQKSIGITRGKPEVGLTIQNFKQK